jgi:hypothetical protein
VNSLHELQQAFVEVLFGTEDAAQSLPISANGLTVARRVQVYRNNMFVSLTEALRAVYPVVDRLVGQQFFDYAAKCYIQQYPATSGNIHDFGRQFADLLTSLPAARELLYLPDVARLEWAYHRVFHAAHDPALDLAELAQAPPDAHADLKLQLCRASRLLRSDYPVLRIWEVNQETHDNVPTLDASAGNVNVLVIRPNLDVEMHLLGAGEFELLQALKTNLNLTDACARALATEPAFDLTNTLKRHALLGTFCAYSL